MIGRLPRLAESSCGARRKKDGERMAAACEERIAETAWKNAAKDAGATRIEERDGWKNN